MNEFEIQPEDVEAPKAEKPKRAPRKPKAEQPKQVSSNDVSKHEDHPKFHKFKGE